MPSSTPILLLLLLATCSCAAKSSNTGHPTYIDSNTPLIQVLLSNKSFSRKWNLIKRKIQKQRPKDLNSLIQTLRYAYPKFVLEAMYLFPTFRKEIYNALLYTRPGLVRDFNNLASEYRRLFADVIKPALIQFSRQLLRLEFGDMLNSATHILSPDFSRLASGLRSMARVIASSAGFGSGEIYAMLLIVLLFMLWKPWLLDWLLSSLLGPLLMAFGATVLVRAFSDLGADRFSIYPAPVDDSSVVMSGLYATVRHPMYAGLIVIVLGLALTSKSIARLALLGAVVSVIIAVMEVEEHLLLDTFPTSYAVYLQRVASRLVPGLY